MSNYTEGLNKTQLKLEDMVNAITTSKYNPFYYHGALPQFYLWVLFLSGLLLFAYYIPIIDSAYDSSRIINAWTSVEYITKTIPFGAVIRALHRYAGDAMVVTIVLHALRVWFTDRYRQYRWVQWISGVVLLIGVLFIGQTGYYLVWDERSLLLTRMTASSFEALPIIGSTLKQWFLNGSEITNFTMANFLFIHIGFSFALLFGLWVHYVRMQRPVITPPPVINYILVAILLVFVALFPITSGPMANLTQQPTNFEVDWFFLWPYVLMAKMSMSLYWFTMIAGTVVFAALPWLFVKNEPIAAAEVVIEKCTGCNLCSVDCPWAAIDMVPAPAGSRFKLLATVKPYRCTSCGVCVGACAFDAIDLPELPDAQIMTQIKSLAGASA
jgi:quinol-cytochrome oxidoreductase complex cytochrome b subunit